MNFIKKIQPNYVGLAKLTPIPGSQIFEALCRKGLVDYSWQRFNIGVANNKETNYTTMNDKEFFSLFDYVQNEIVQPILDKNYFSYNTTRHPIRVFRTLGRKFKSGPAAIFKRILHSARLSD